MLISKLISIVFISILYSSGEVNISRSYLINSDLNEKDLIQKDEINLEGGISFQACD